MISWLGSIALYVALLAAMVQSAAWWRASASSSTIAQGWGRGALLFQSVAIAVSYGLLTLAFIVNDFHLVYVASHSQRALPLVYRITAVWGGHEGSLLLWLLILTAWGLALWCKRDPFSESLYVRSGFVLSVLSVGFLLFMVGTSNPFDTFPDYFLPKDGRSLNPILQDPGLIIHPPLLYMGYVGFSVVFALALAALLVGELDEEWSRRVRPWVLTPWVCLTIGIVLGSWWAYRELGWGGWWFWDPVENASFMPWLLGTALFHALLVTERKAWLRGWVVLLSLGTFCLSLLGTFLVRSGVLISVHSFAADPSRGVFLLAMLFVMVATCLLLYSYHQHKLLPQQETPLPAPKLVSRETLLLLNTVFFLTLMFTVFLGTLYPLILDILHGDKISVGPPYFNALFVPLAVPLCLLMGVAPHCAWSTSNNKKLWKSIQRLFLLSLAFTMLMLGMVHFPLYWSLVLTVGMASWLIASTALYGYTHWHKGLHLRQWGMLVAHTGVAVFILGVGITTHYSESRDVRFDKGGRATIGPYVVEFTALSGRRAANYFALQGHFKVYKNEKPVATLLPEKRIYSLQSPPISHAAIDAGWRRDIYVALGQPLDKEAWSVRLYYKPYIRWIWGGGLLMALGGLLTVLGRREGRHVK